MITDTHACLNRAQIDILKGIMNKVKVEDVVKEPYKIEIRIESPDGNIKYLTNLTVLEYSMDVFFEDPKDIYDIYAMTYNKPKSLIFTVTNLIPSVDASGREYMYRIIDTSKM